MKISSEQEMIEAGEKIFDELEGNVIELVGDVGAGKTTLVKGIAIKMGVLENITSPSFTISKSYAGEKMNLVHYDFYRLSDPGIMKEDLKENISDTNNIVVVEWSDSVKEILPEKHTKVIIKYNNDNSREMEVL